MNTTIDLDDLFNDIYYMDLPGAAQEPATDGSEAEPEPIIIQSRESAAAVAAGAKRKADDSSFLTISKELTEEQKIERRERNREHAKRSRLRKKFLLESLQEQIHGLEEQIEKFKQALKTELPDKAEQVIKDVCGDKEKYTPLPMPSGFGPVKTLMEPDFRLSKSNSQRSIKASVTYSRFLLTKHALF
jgi:hypothetical protein